MPSVDSFSTTRGVARVTDDAIRFEESFAGYLRALYRGYWQTDRLWRKGVFAGYVVGLVYAFGWLVRSILNGDVLLPAVVVVALAGVQVAEYLRGYRKPDRIPLERIESVSATRGEKGLTRPRVVITYASDGTSRQRRVNLPSMYTRDGETVYERALDALERRGFEVE